MRTDQPSQPGREPVLALPMACGRTTRGNPAYFPQAEHGGKTLYFCTESCLHAFASDPDRFYPAHRRARQPRGPAKDGPCPCE